MDPIPVGGRTVERPLAVPLPTASHRPGDLLQGDANRVVAGTRPPVGALRVVCRGHCETRAGGGTDPGGAGPLSTPEPRRGQEDRVARRLRRRLDTFGRSARPHAAEALPPRRFVAIQPIRIRPTEEGSPIIRRCGDYFSHPRTGDSVWVERAVRCVPGGRNSMFAPGVRRLVLHRFSRRPDSGPA